MPAQSAFARAKELHIRMLCEGVSARTVGYAVRGGCALMQGYALSMPVSTGCSRECCADKVCIL